MLAGGHRLPRAADITLTFHDRFARLADRLPTLFERTVTDGMIWVCWPKKASKLPTDLDENVVRDLDIDLIETVRNRWQFYRDRRPDMYGPLTEA